MNLVPRFWKLLRGAYDWLDRHRFTPHPHYPPEETTAERRRWLLLMLAGWLTMAGALLASSTLLESRLLLIELSVLVAAAFPLAWRLHFSRMPRFWPNYATFFIALILGIIHWRLGVFTGGAQDSQLLLSYRTLVGLFYWVMAFRAFAIRTVRDLTQTALPAVSGLLLVLIASPTPTAIAGTALVFAGTLAMLAGEHAAQRSNEIDETADRAQVRGGKWRPKVNSWVSLLLAAAVAAVILAGVATRIDSSNRAGQWLRRQLAWRIARLMIGRGSTPYASGRTLELGGPGPTPRDRLMLTLESEVGMKVRTATYDIYRGRSWEQSEREWTRMRTPTNVWDLPSSERFGLSPAVTEKIEVTITAGHSFLGTLPVPWCPDNIALEVPSIRYDRTGMIMFNGHILPGDSYTATVATPDAISAPPGSPRPPDVDLQTTLQVPDALPSRVRKLTEDIVAETEGRPVGIALAIEDHLSQYPYDLEAPPTPQGRDFVDHFLFSSKRGWCNHYATAMVVMSRIAGIPARLATGFTAGEWVPERNAFEIRDQDAHAWAELYLPDTGWIDFDPTPLEEQEEESTAGEGLRERGAGIGAFFIEVGQRLRANLQLAAGLAVLVAAIVAGAILLARWYRRRLRPLRPGADRAERIIHAYRQALRWLARDEIVRPESAAPWEFYEEVARRRPRLAGELAVLTASYVRARFSTDQPPDSLANDTEQSLARLREAIFSPDPDEEDRDAE